MTRVMADSIKPSIIPAHLTVAGKSYPVDLTAGYVNGMYVRDKHTDVTIDVIGTRPDADVLDVEIGDATPDHAPGWIRAHKAATGNVGTIYCNRSNITAVFNAMRAQGLQVVKDFVTWIATLDGTQTVPDMLGVRAVQCWGQRHTGVDVDGSIVYDASWKITSPPPPPAVYGYLVYHGIGSSLTGRAVVSHDDGKSWT